MIDPRAILFPYTTLFRSDHQADLGELAGLQGEPARDAHPDARAPAEVGADKWQQRRDQGDDRDRKSTRLNSSRLVISYAVFCLKKKNDHNNMNDEGTLTH